MIPVLSPHATREDTGSRSSKCGECGLRQRARRGRFSGRRRAWPIPAPLNAVVVTMLVWSASARTALIECILHLLQFLQSLPELFPIDGGALIKPSVLNRDGGRNGEGLCQTQMLRSEPVRLR